MSSNVQTRIITHDRRVAVRLFETVGEPRGPYIILHQFEYIADRIVGGRVDECFDFLDTSKQDVGCGDRF
jgi:hypothetical protein